MKMSHLRLRNLTTGILHTKLLYVYDDIAYLVGDFHARLGIALMSYQLGMSIRSLKPFLASRVPADFFEDVYNPKDVGEIEIEPLSEQERDMFFESVKREHHEFCTPDGGGCGIGIALKSRYVGEFEEKFLSIVERAVERLQCEEGVCYVFRGMFLTLLHPQENQMAKRMYTWLGNVDKRSCYVVNADFRWHYEVQDIVGAWLDCDDDRYRIRGGWNRNPWNLGIQARRLFFTK